MADEAVIIAGALDSKELEKSIDALVKNVEAGTQKMATNFDNTIEGMKKKLQSLGNISIDMGGVSDGGSSRRARKIQDEEQGIRRLTTSYDQLAIATQRAMQPKSAQDSFYTFLQSYREHAAALARELKQMPSASLDRQFAEYQRFESEIMRVQELIRKLRSQLNEVGKNPNASRFEVKAITDEIGLLENKIRQLTSEQIANTRRIANEDNIALLQKKALYDNTLQIIREMTTVEKQGTTAILSQVDAQEQLNRKVQRQAEIIRQRMAESGNQFATWGSAVIYDPSIKKDHASIEEQLTKAHQDHLRITQERIAAEQREKQTKQETLAVTQQQAQAEQQVTSAQQQRSGVKSTPKTFQNYDDFRAALAHVLGLQQQEIKLADEETASYNKLSATLKTLQSAYNQLSASERNSDNGRTLVASMHEVERAMQRIKAQAARPVSLESIIGINGKGGLSEKTLDDIAYKLRTLQSYRSGLDLTKQADEVKRTTQEIDRLQKKQNEVIGTTRRWAKENDAVSRSFDYIKNRLAFMFTIGAATNFVKQIYEIRGQYELLERSIGILVDSLQQGSQIFAELNAMAIKSPFTTMELGAAAKQLTAYDIAAKDVVDTTKRLADMAAAVGVPIERLTYALGQIKAYGYLNARDARMFANAGIPLVQELADRYTELEGRIVSVGDVYDRIKKKAISFEDVLGVINNVTDEGGRFFNFQEKAADTLKVKLANLTLAWNNMMNEIGKSNQSLLTMPLSALKTLFEHWRDLNNIIMSVAVSFGVVKLAQIAYYVWMRNATLATAAHVAIGGKFVRTLAAMKASLVGFATNPFAMAIAGLTLMGTLLAKAVFDYNDLREANEAFNKSIADGAEENIKSIDKFFEEYKKQLDGIGGANAAIQQKMWERLREEIEKASKSAQTYLQILDNIGDVNKRISVGREVLEQIQEINKEAKSLAERGLFDVGGGFADNSLAKDLQEYGESFNKLIKEYGSFKDAAKDAVSEAATSGVGISFHSWGNYLDILKEAERELGNFTSVLDKANLSKIMGDGTPESQIANIREFTSIIRDNFLATEQGQKVSANGRALLNHQLDEWIAKQGIANGLINSERATIEANRTAWETFFDQLNKKDKERLDYMVETNQTGSEDFRKIWDKATKAMSENANTSYLQIQDQIANLRNTPDIVIKVVYRETKEKLDAQQKQYEKDFLTPVGTGVLSIDKYFEKRKKLVEKYGRFQKKEGENNVEWEKRLGEEYRNISESIKKLNAQLANSANLSKVDREAKEKELKTFKDQRKALDEVKNKQNFDYSKKTNHSKKTRTDKDVVAEALKQELQLIREMQSNYDKLRKSGVSNMDAIDIASKGYEATIIRINKVLSKFGIDKFNAANFAGKDVRSLLQSLEEQRQALLASGKVKTSSLKDLDVEIQKLTVDAKTYDMKKVTDGLNSELGKIKDEYELAVELDANPELGSIFADYMGIDLNELPKNAEEATKKAQQYIDKILRENKSKEKIDITSLMGKDAFDKWIKSSGHSMDDELVKIVDNYRQTLHKMQVDESKKQMQEWDKLLEKYAEYEYKVTQIQKEAERERETARKKGASQEILDAINERERQELAKLSFEEFQKSPEWIVATGDLANMSKSAIGMLIEQLEKYKRSAKNLSPKQIKQLNSALSKLYKEQRKNNPFKAISNMLDEAKERMSTFDEDIKKTQEEIDNLTKKKKVSIIEGITDKETDNKLKKAIKRLQELKKNQEEVGNVSASDWVASINETVEAVKVAVGVFDDLAKAIGGVENSDIDKVFSILEKGGQGAAIGAQAGGGWGALIGGVAGAATGIITTFADQWSGNAGITEKINSSERAVKRLELAYIDLEHAVKQAYGMATIGANMEAKANKELQLLELKRQLALERSRDSKHSDDDKIIDLQKQIKELEYDIADTVDDIVNNLLGISSVGDAVENMIGGIIESLRSGEDAMVGFNKSVDEMIANMLKKFLATKILAPMFENVWNEIKDEIQSRTKNESDALAKAQAEAVRTKGLDYGDYYGWIRPNLYDNSSGVYEWVKRYLKEEGIDIRQAADLSLLADESAKQAFENFVNWVMTKEKEDAEKATKQAQKELDKASMPTEDDLMDFANNARELSPQMEEYIEYIKQLIERLGLMKSGDEKTLSNLQQGIQGITEDTAGALEAYMNGVSQQVYYHSSLLEQIRDSVVGLDLDVSLGVQSQMLLQLQNSYQTQQAIKQILEGVLTPSGRAFSVELLS